MRVLCLFLLAACGKIGFDPTDVRDASVDAPPGVIVASALSVEWATPNRTMWRWEWTGDPAMLDHFELVTGPSEDDVRFRSAAAVIIGPAQRPELGHPTLPGTTDMDRVIHTLVEAVPGETVLAALIAVDRMGGETWTQIEKVRSPPIPPNTILLYDDAFLPGSYTLPPELVESSDLPASGPIGLRFDSTCPGASCFENLRIQGLSISLTDIMAQGAFEVAYLEMLVSTQLAPSYWSQLRLCLQDCTANNRIKYDWITIAPGPGYARIQIPFHAMTNESDGTPLTTARLMTPVYEVAIGGSWAAGSTTRVDEVRIRY